MHTTDSVLAQYDKLQNILETGEYEENIKEELVALLFDASFRIDDLKSGNISKKEIFKIRG